MSETLDQGPIIAWDPQTQQLIEVTITDQQPLSEPQDNPKAGHTAQEKKPGTMLRKITAFIVAPMLAGMYVTSSVTHLELRSPQEFSQTLLKVGKLAINSPNDTSSADNEELIKGDQE